jgi:hypothetical protein
MAINEDRSALTSNLLMSGRGQPLKRTKSPLFSKPAGCFIQLGGAVFIFWKLGKLIESPADILGAIFPFAAGGALLLLGRKPK